MCTLSNINNLCSLHSVLLFLVLVGNSALFQLLHALTLVVRSYALLCILNPQATDSVSSLKVHTFEILVGYTAVHTNILQWVKQEDNQCIHNNC